MNDVLILKSFPFPPSVNESYQSVRRGFKSSVISTDALRRFKLEVEIYQRLRMVEMLSHHAKVQAWIDDGYVLKAKIYLLWPHEAVYTKTKKAKSKYQRLDGNNRIKATLDAVATCLDIDDSYFFDDGTEKMVQLEGMPKCAVIVISKTKVRTAKDLMESLPQLKREDFSV